MWAVITIATAFLLLLALVVFVVMRRARQQRADRKDDSRTRHRFTASDSDRQPKAPGPLAVHQVHRMRSSREKEKTGLKKKKNAKESEKKRRREPLGEDANRMR